MGFEEILGRIIKAAIFGALAAVGLGLTFGFVSLPMLLCVVVAACILLATLTEIAIIASVGVFVVGISIAAGLTQRGVNGLTI